MWEMLGVTFRALCLVLVLFAGIGLAAFLLPLGIVIVVQFVDLWGIPQPVFWGCLLSLLVTVFIQKRQSAQRKKAVHYARDGAQQNRIVDGSQIDTQSEPGPVSAMLVISSTRQTDGHLAKPQHVER